MPKVEKESKYAVIIPMKDWVELTDFQQKLLSILVDSIDQRRKEEGSTPLSQNRYIVCNQDEPYASEVWDIILEGEKKKMLEDENN